MIGFTVLIWHLESYASKHTMRIESTRFHDLFALLKHVLALCGHDYNVKPRALASTRR